MLFFFFLNYQHHGECYLNCLFFFIFWILRSSGNHYIQVKAHYLHQEKYVVMFE